MELERGEKLFREDTHTGSCTEMHSHPDPYNISTYTKPHIDTHLHTRTVTHKHVHEYKHTYTLTSYPEMHRDTHRHTHMRARTEHTH